MLVGVIILTSEASKIIKLGLELWKKLLPPNELGNRGINGPKVFMSDDSALHEVFPKATLLLCIFHVLQATWRYLWDSNHGIPLKFRLILYSGIKKMVYAENNDELNISFNKILQYPLTNEFLRFRTYVERLFERKSEWSIYLRVNLITRGQNNNISEAGVKIMKDVVLNRTKAYSSVQLFFFIVQDLDTFYKMKILDVAANHPPQYLKKRFLITKIQQKSLKYEAIQSSDSLYLVHNTLKNTTYNIDLDTGLCSCLKGNTGKPCKHQIFVAKDLKRELGLCFPVTEEIRNRMFRDSRWMV
jgi:hypothetical protein